MRTGVIIAIKTEFLAFMEQMNRPFAVEKADGYDVWEYAIGKNEIFAVMCGAGEIRAAAATQMLISKYSVDRIVNFGICGGLTKEMSLFKTVVVGSVVHYDFDTSAVDDYEAARYPEYDDCYIPTANRLADETGLRKVICASGDKFIADPIFRRKLFKDYHAEICDMEAAGILLTANRAKIPALMLKTISDSTKGGADEYKEMATRAARICVDLLKKIGGITND